MEYELHFDLVDNTTGEVLSSNKQCTYNTDIEKENDKIQRYVDCFIRGLKLGKDLALCVSATRYHVPVHLNIF